MSYKKDTIEIKLNSYGTLDVVCVPVKLYKDSYNVVKLRVLAPDKSGAVVKVCSTGRNVAGEQVWTSEPHDVPLTQETKVFGDATYRVYERMLPQEFCLESGDLNLTFAQVVTTSGAEEIITSGTLNLYISGEGFNYAGVKISDYDVLAGKVNEVIENAVNKEDIAELEDKIINSASKDELAEVDERLTGEIAGVNTKIDSINVPGKLSELQDDVGYAKTGDENTFWANQKFYRGIHIRVGTGYPFVDIGNSKVTPSGQDYTVAVIRHTAINQQNNQTKESSLYLPTRSGTFALTKDIEEATTPEALLEKIEDSETIVHTLSNEKLKFELDAEVQSKIEKSLVTPVSTPSATELVAVDSTNSQTMIEIGDGLSLENGTLKATGGGGGGDFVETDPTVPAWAKNATKPTYTASEVGAVASTNGTASNLNVTNFTITGALTSGVSNGIWVSSDGQNFRIQNPSTFVSVNNIEKNTNKTTAISNASTDTQYPSAKAVYDYVQSAMQNAIQDTWEASY